ncbi:nuclear transport factor 2 family protein [Actinokineospora sp. NBRC 105648]|uniref:nuclear transport factor 2 family protein n=1 Tax=Actinokineospora sp. NBRC 105648 TaxID=3032206 RepID=UPI0024A5B1A2|nr:nuclear transport factor 2 family protein [Actinokineospora sp. NBRC 105648]GLZ42351.1 hypothetical protein Acsp05_59750 [Actinokineospora sp. NBRC 105648]
MRPGPAAVRRRPVVAGTGIRRPSPGRPPTPAEAVAVDTAAPADVVVTEDLDASDTDELVEADPAASGADAVRRRVLPWVLVALALLVSAAGTWLALQARDSGGNAALVDTGATAEVSTQVRDAVERVFSYSYTDTAATEAAAGDLLTGAAKTQYEQLFRQVREQAPAQQLVLRSHVVLSGVSVLDGDRATLLVFLDQAATRGDNGQATTAGAQLSITAEKVDGRWRISALVPR